MEEAVSLQEGAVEGQEWIPFIVEDGMVPTKCSDVCVREEVEEDGLHLAFEPRSDTVLMMNATAWAIFDLCNGARTVGEIVQQLSQTFAVPHEVNIQDGVRKYLAVLRARQFVEFK